jgi:hypothetical protein
VQKGAAEDVRTCDTGGLTASSWAACNGHVHVGRWLLAHGCFGEDFDDLTAAAEAAGATSAHRVEAFAACCAANSGDHITQLSGLVKWAQVTACGSRAKSNAQSFTALHLVYQEILAIRAAFVDLTLPTMTIRWKNYGTSARPGGISLQRSRGEQWPSSLLTAPGRDWATAVSREEGSALGALSGCPGLRQHVAEFIGVATGRVLRYVRGFEAEASALDSASHPCSDFLVIAKKEGRCACS